jgi:hypothetical protein
VPLVHEVIPMLEAMEHDLTKVRDSLELPTVIRIAAIAALLMISKYYALTDDNEVYRIAIGMPVIHFLIFITELTVTVMCPDKKIDWFTLNEDWRAEDRAEVDRIVRKRWTETYLKHSATPNSATTGNGLSASEKTPEKVREQVFE